MTKTQPIQSVQRAVAILYAVAGVEEGRSVPQIAAVLGIKPNTCHKLVLTLEREGLLVRRNKPLRFMLGQAIRELNRLDEDRQLLTLASKWMTRAHGMISSANLVFLEWENAITYQRLRCNANSPGRVIRQRNVVILPYYHISPLVFLTYADQQEALVFDQTYPFDSLGKPIWGSRRRFESYLATIRRQGYAVSGPEISHWFRVAAPIFSPGNEVLAVIGGYVAQKTSQTIQSRLVKIVTSTARQLTEQYVRGAER
jgi:DNA-binding IclR family transcriptional regulator